MIIRVGWNMCSSNGYSDQINTFLGEHNANITLIYKYTSTSGYILVSDRTSNFEQGVGYWFKSDLEFTYEKTGTNVVSPLEIIFASGWIMVAPPFNGVLIVANEPWASSVDLIYEYSNQYNLKQKTDELDSSQGYWFKFNSSVTQIFTLPVSSEPEPYF